jgi:hypothetical protein
MSPSDSPYVFRDEDVEPDGDVDEPAPPHEQDVVIVDGRAMSYRWYRR